VSDKALLLAVMVGVPLFFAFLHFASSTHASALLMFYAFAILGPFLLVGLVIYWLAVVRPRDKVREKQESQ
jgi:hypothetical protein